MGRGHLRHVVDLSAGGLSPVERLAIPGGLSRLFMTHEDGSGCWDHGDRRLGTRREKEEQEG